MRKSGNPVESTLDWGTVLTLRFKCKNSVIRWIDSGTADRRLEIDLLPLAEVQVPPEPEEDEVEEDKIETST